MRSGRPRAALAAVSAATATLLVVTAGCTSERGGGTGSDNGSGAEPTVELTGPPVTLGYVTMENSALGSFPETRAAAEAAVDYANTSLGGVNGRPLELQTCAANGSPESSQDCANRLVALDPVAVIGGVDVGAEAAMPIYAQAGIPYVSGSPQLNGELNSTNSFSLTGGTLAELLGLTEYLTSTRDVDSVHALYVDLPGLLTVALQSSESILRQKGVTDVTLVAEKADAADFAPALNRVADGDPDAVVIVFEAQACARIVQAASALGIDTPIYLIGSCATPAVARAAGGSTDNLYFASGYIPVSESDGDADSAAFRERIPAEARTSGSQGSFSAVLVARSLLADLAEVTPTALTSALRATRDHPNVMAHPFTCDGKQIEILPSICNTAVRLLQWDGSAFTDVAGAWTDGRHLVDLVS